MANILMVIEGTSIKYLRNRLHRLLQLDSVTIKAVRKSL